MRTFGNLGAAIRAAMDRWVFRPGIMKSAGKAMIRTNWDITVDRRTSSWLLQREQLSKQGRLRKDRAGRLWKQARSGLWLPLQERFAYANLITNAGLTSVADVYFSAATQITSWYVIPFAASPTVAAGDTPASHAGWTEFTDYDEAARPDWVDAGASAGAVTNAANPAVFTSSSDSNTIGGCGIISVATKSATTGTFYGGGAFSQGNKDLDTDETLSASSTYSFADDGA